MVELAWGGSFNDGTTPSSLEVLIISKVEGYICETAAGDSEMQSSGRSGTARDKGRKQIYKSANRQICKIRTYGHGLNQQHQNYTEWP